MHRFGVYQRDRGIPKRNCQVEAAPSGPIGIERLAFELGREWARDQKGPRPATELSKALEVMQLPREVIEANVGRVWRELNAEPNRDVIGRRPRGGPVMQADLDTVVRQIALDVMEEYPQRTAAAIIAGS